MNIRFLVTGLMLFLTSCALQTAQSGYPPVNQPLRYNIKAQIVDIPIFRDGTSDGLVSKKAQPVSSVLARLAASPAGFIRLTAHETDVGQDRLYRLVEETGLNLGRDVEIREKSLPGEFQGSRPVLTVRAVYYLYKIPDCGTLIPARLLERPGLASPAFGCAVTKNRMISLARPDDWNSARRQDADSALLDAAAVSRLFAGTSHPLINQGGGTGAGN
ncbi:MAG: hypothetical protein EP348_00010 [Alphaproteobacteria bacterium]|nr:MAG: hypothetical protein EP348_00010 [Alphaproteobacteria bacterium]